MKTIKSLEDALRYELRGQYDMEKKLSQRFQRFIENITSEELKKEVVFYINNAEKQIVKLIWALQYLKAKPVVRRNLVANAMLKEIEKTLRHTATTEIYDTLVAGYVEKICRYKNFVYEHCFTLAHELRLHNIEEILVEILDQEKKAEKVLAQLEVKEITEEILTEMK